MAMVNEKFCPSNTTFIDIWVQHGILKCLFQNISDSAAFLHILIFGPLQMLLFNRYESVINSHSLPKKKLYKLQKCFHNFILIVSFLDIALKATILDGKYVYSSMVRHFK